MSPHTVNAFFLFRLHGLKPTRRARQCICRSITAKQIPNSVHLVIWPPSAQREKKNSVAKNKFHSKKVISFLFYAWDTQNKTRIQFGQFFSTKKNIALATVFFFVVEWLKQESLFILFILIFTGDFVLISMQKLKRMIKLKSITCFRI